MHLSLGWGVFYGDIGDNYRLQPLNLGYICGPFFLLASAIMCAQL